MIMNKLCLATLVSLQAVAATVWTAVDDPRCHESPDKPVLEPSPSPTPLPPPGQYREMPDPDPTPPPPCSGQVSGFKVYDLDTNTAVYDLEDGATVLLSALPDHFTIMADASGVTEVSFYLDDAVLSTSSQAPYLIQSSEYTELYMEGTYTLKAMGDDAVECSATITVEYGNLYTCEGVVEKFMLVNTETGEVIDSLLDSSDNLDKASLPEHMTIVAVTNGRGSGDVFFSYNNDNSYSSTSVAPYAISGSDLNGNPLPWSVLNEVEVLTISAWTSDASGVEESGSKVCEISIQITQDWECPYTVSSFSVIYAGTNTPVPGYDHILGHKAIDLIETGDDLTIEAHSSSGGVKFYINGAYERQENVFPYAINGDKNGGTFLHAAEFLRTPGRYVITALHKTEDSTKVCSLTLTVMKDTTLETIDNDDVCGAEMVVPEMVGNHMPRATPFEVVARDIDNTVTFKTKQTFLEENMDWVTTAFTTQYGIQVCDKIDDMASDALSPVEYTTKCYNGFAFVDVYAYSSSFTYDQAHADTSMLAAGCKGAGENVIKYTYVFPCDCNREVPDVVTGGLEKKQPVCSGSTGGVWGDPHIIPLNARIRDSNNWNCQGVGEFIMAQADLVGYSYDFEMRARFTKYRQSLPWSFNSAIVVKQDVTVQVGIAEFQNDKSLMMENVALNLYVDGVQRSFSQGSGDHRVSITYSGYHVYIGFATTGIMVDIQVRPFAVDNHANIMSRHPGAVIPGSFSTHICFPDDNENIQNMKGLIGTPTQDFADDFMLPDGTPIAEPSDKLSYCEDNWCVTDPAETLFSFETNYTFADYNECGTRRELRELTADPETCDFFGQDAGVCEQVCGDAENLGACLMEFDFGGEWGAWVARETMVGFAEFAKAALAAKRADDARCCSDNYQTCNEPLVQDANQCATAFLEHGSNLYVNGANQFTCTAKGGSCISASDCCQDVNANPTWEMTCESNTCTVQGSRRRLASLEDFKMVRPDLADGVSFVTLGSVGK